MDFSDKVKALASKVTKTKSTILTEEAVKTAYVLPFIQCLGYDPFDPHEVIPEYTADLGIKKGEKVDYAICREGELTLIIECKAPNENLDPHKSQLFRYFHTVHARFALLTNGIKYLFYTDLDSENKMDERPFLEMDLENLDEKLLEEVQKFHKEMFDQENILGTASELKYTKNFKDVLQAEMLNPSEEMVRILAKRIYPSNVTAKLIEQFTPILKNSFGRLIDEIISERLRKAGQQTHVDVETTMKVEVSSEPMDSGAVQQGKIATTEEEREAFRIIKAILRREVPVDKVAGRDTQSYFGILYEDNNRKPVARLYSDSVKIKRIGILAADKTETKYNLDSIEDIYNYAEELCAAVKQYISVSEAVATPV